MQQTILHKDYKAMEELNEIKTFKIIIIQLFDQTYSKTAIL